MQPLISIIIPIYKVEPYLRRCVDSIVNQTYTNLEIILVDDGSPDNCPAICDEYAVKDNRIVVIHKENGGLSSARNAGLKICKGSYVSFVDSDDWIANNFVEELLNLILKENTTIAIADFTKIYSGFHSNDLQTKKITFSNFTPQQAILQLFSNKGTTFVIAWGKLYSTDLFKNIKFPNGCIHEDEYTTYKLFYASSKISFLDIPLYYYYQRNDSIMGMASQNKKNALQAHIERFYFFKSKKEKKIQLECSKRLCWDLLFAYSEAIIHNTIPLGYKTKKDILRDYRTFTGEYNSFHATHITHVFLHKIFSIFPFLYLSYRKLYTLLTH